MKLYKFNSLRMLYSLLFVLEYHQNLNFVKDYSSYGDVCIYKYMYMYYKDVQLICYRDYKSHVIRKPTLCIIMGKTDAQISCTTVQQQKK